MQSIAYRPHAMRKLTPPWYMQIEVQGIEHRITDVRRNIEKQLELWRDLRQQRHSALMQVSKLTLQATAPTTSSQHYASVARQSAQAQFRPPPAAVAASVAPADVPQWVVGGTGGDAVGEHSVARAMAAVHITGVVPQEPITSLNEQSHAAGSNTGATGAPVELQASTDPPADSEPQPEALMHHCTGACHCILHAFTLCLVDSSSAAILRTGAGFLSQDD